MSKIFSAEELHSIVGGKLFKNDWLVSGISIDSRTIKNNDLFIALKAKRDGNDFIVSAIENGAKSVTAVATHAILSGPAIDRIKDSAISKLIVTDTVSIPENKKLENMQIVTVSEVFAEAIKRVFDGKSVSALFEF